jgi:hypothetical protein
MRWDCHRTPQYGGAAPATLGFNAVAPEWLVACGAADAAPAVPAAESTLGVAVGMTIADHPPHRSVLAELPHTAPPSDTSVKADIGIWMKSAGTRNPPIEDRPQTIPVWLPPLTAPA